MSRLQIQCEAFLEPNLLKDKVEVSRVGKLLK